LFHDCGDDRDYRVFEGSTRIEIFFGEGHFFDITVDNYAFREGDDSQKLRDTLDGRYLKKQLSYQAGSLVIRATASGIDTLNKMIC
jgi:hypothetical protein